MFNVCSGEQDMQNSLDRESSSLQDLESQKQIAQERLEEMDQQRSKLEGMVNDVKQKCQEESQMVRDSLHEQMTTSNQRNVKKIYFCSLVIYLDTFATRYSDFFFHFFWKYSETVWIWDF